MESINPFVRYAGITPNFFVTRKNRRAFDNRIFYFLKGKGYFVVGGAKHEIENGKMFFVPSCVQYAFDIDKSEECSLLAVNFDFDQENSSVLSPYGNGYEGVEQGEKPEIFTSAVIVRNAFAYGHELQKIVTLFYGQEQFYREKSSAILKLVLLNMVTSDGNSRSAVNEIIAFIRENCEIPLKITDVAKRFNYHPNHLTRLVKKQTGLSFKDYLIRSRINSAKIALATTDESITEIGLNSGFSSPAYFAKIFLLVEGETPSSYRKKMKNTV